MRQDNKFLNTTLRVTLLTLLYFYSVHNDHVPGKRVKVTPWSFMLRNSIHGPARSFHAHFSIEVVLHEMHFFSPLFNNRNPYSFRKQPRAPPLTGRSTMRPDHSTIQRNRS